MRRFLSFNLLLEQARIGGDKAKPSLLSRYLSPSTKSPSPYENQIFGRQMLSWRQYRRDFFSSSSNQFARPFLSQQKQMIAMERVLSRTVRSLSFSLQRRSGASQLFSSVRRFWSYRILTPDGIVWFLIGANISVFLLWGIANPSFMRKHFMISLDNFKSGRLHTLVTSAFSHSELDHLFTNMIGLYFFGSSIANQFGPQFLLKLYLAGAISGSIFFLVHRAFLLPSTPGYRGWDRSRVPALGASAAVNSIILLEIFLFPKRLVYLYFLIPLPAALVGALLIGSDLWRVEKGQSHVSGAAHLGGALVAALVWARIKKRWI